MLTHSSVLQAISLFVAAADSRYGPITTIQRDGEPSKHIPWIAFTLSDSDWDRVADARDILAVSTPYNFISFPLLMLIPRIPISSNKLSLPKTGPPFGVDCHLSKNFRQNGRRSAMGRRAMKGSRYTRRQSRTA